MTIAEKIAEILGNDGQNWETKDGLSLENLAEQMDAKVVYSQREYMDDGIKYVEGYPGDHFSGDPIRYIFPDGSIIVTHGDAWDFEGNEPFSWKG